MTFTSLTGTWPRLPDTSLVHMQIELHSIAPGGQLGRRIVPLVEDGDEPTPVECHRAMPAREFFSLVDSNKDAISAALDGLKAGGQGPCTSY